jgi:glucosamine kinase
MNKIILAIDGGGTKTEAIAYSQEKGIFGRAVSGPSSPRNQGIKKSAENISESAKQALKNNKVDFVFAGLASVEEEYKEKIPEIKKEILKFKIFSNLKEKNLVIGGDQLTAFLSGTDQEDGIVAISGTGSLVRGWNKGKEYKVSGWGYFGDEGSSFWTGIKAYQSILKDLDGRGDKTLITNKAFKILGFNNIEELNKIVYEDPFTLIPKLSIAVDLSSELKDKTSLNILKEASRELVLSVKVVSKKIYFKKKFPLVLIGGMFKSNFLLNEFKRNIKKEVPLANIIRPEDEPVFGSLKLAKKIYEQKQR